MGCIFSEKGCLKIHYFSAKVKREIETRTNSFSYAFLTVQNHSLNSNDLYARALKVIYLKHNIDYFIEVTVCLSSEHKRISEKFQLNNVLTKLLALVHKTAEKSDVYMSRQANN